MKKTKAYKSIPIIIGLNRDISKNRVRFFSCYHSPLDAKFESHSSKYIVKCLDFPSNMFFYIAMTISEIQKSYFRFEMPDRLVFAEDKEDYEKYLKGDLK